MPIESHPLFAHPLLFPPPRFQLSARSPKLLLHPELAECHRYTLTLLWAGLLCPAELYRPQILEVFKALAADNPLLPIYREQVRLVSSGWSPLMHLLPG
jgi:hypothetical protein